MQGKVPFFTFEYNGVEDHPCGCREKIVNLCFVSRVTGSPLRVQGKVLIPSVIWSLVRITPACAGKSKRHNGFAATTKDHPCVCREKKRFIAVVNVGKGSPLRVQGKGHYYIAYRQQSGITPACAGKRKCITQCLRCYRDHPCVCREKVSV